MKMQKKWLTMVIEINTYNDEPYFVTAISN